MKGLVCPHYCCSCGVFGEILCECCKKYIIKNAPNICLECGEATCDGICEYCQKMYGGSWCLGYRDEIVGLVAEYYKYKPIRALSMEFADMLNELLPCWGNVKIVSLPTIGKHVRERGFDHVLLVAKKLARARGWDVDNIVKRRAETVQMGASRSVRKQQAQEAYSLDGVVDGLSRYLVLDDIYTTGASIKTVCNMLKSAGATRIDVAVIARSR